MVLAAIGTILIVVGYLYSATRFETRAMLLNVSLEAAVLWMTAYLVLRYRSSSRSLEDREQRLRALVGTAVDGVMIIDSRPYKPKYVNGHIPTAVNIPFSQFDKMVDKLPEDKTTLLIFYCGGPA